MARNLHSGTIKSQLTRFATDPSRLPEVEDAIPEDITLSEKPGAEAEIDNEISHFQNIPQSIYHRTAFPFAWSGLLLLA